MKKDLMYTLPVLLATACSNPTDETPRSSIDCILHPPEESLQPYYDVLTENEKLADAIGFCSFSGDFHENMWNKIQEAEKTGLPPTAPIPKSLNELIMSQTTIYLTSEEAHEIYAAHLAHSLWLEKNEIVPWSIFEYNQEQLEELLQPQAWFDSWDDVNKEYMLTHIADYSPRETFFTANEMVPSFSNQKSALVDIVIETRSYRHGNKKDKKEISTIPEMAKEKISRHGCQTMSRYIVQIANSINIPGKTIEGYYFDDRGHRSAVFEFTDDVLAHGDDVYHAYLGNTPSSKLMDSYEFWKVEVIPYQGKEPGAHNSQINNVKNKIKYIAEGLLHSYCLKGEDGRAFLTETFGEFASEEEIDYLEQQILGRSKDCTAYPKNNPDD